MSLRTVWPVLSAPPQPRVIPRARVNRATRSGWTRPLYDDATMTLSALIDPVMWRKELWAWTLMSVMADELGARRDAMLRGADHPGVVDGLSILVPGPHEWVDMWEATERGMAEALGPEGETAFVEWFGREFYPKVDWWRNWIGWSEEAANALHSDVTWRFTNPSPNQEGAHQMRTLAMIRHPRDPDVWVELPLGEELDGDMTALVRLYWIRKMWAFQMLSL